MHSTNDTMKPLASSLIFKQFMFFFIPAIFLAGIAFALFDSLLTQNDQSALLASQQTKISLTRKLIEREFRIITSDLRFLSNSDLLLTSFDEPQKINLNMVTKNFNNLALSKGLYDQVRFLDNNGMEKIRINYTAGVSKTVPTNELQNKYNRYYFADSIKLSKDEIFISPFDLNIELGAIEQPFKPMIRFGTPVFDNGGEKKGVIILNYLGEILLNRIKDLFGNDKTFCDVAQNNIGCAMLLNKDGYFLLSKIRADEWGFMFNNEVTFGKKFPNEWQSISARQSGQIETVNGLFTFTTIEPLTEGQSSSTGSPLPFKKSAKATAHDEYNWILISHVDLDILSAIENKHHHLIVNFFLLFAGVISVGCFILARTRLQKFQAEKQLKRQALHDNLTGLPNRNLLYDRLGQAIASHMRNSEKFAILFIDLDNFKEINDKMGHEAGDTTLQKISDRLRKSVRASDTVARLGGDEFLVILQGINKTDEPAIIAQNIIRLVSEPIALEEGVGQLGASIGGSIFPIHATTLEKLISQADKAMYDAKKSGKNCFKLTESKVTTAV